MTDLDWGIDALITEGYGPLPGRFRLCGGIVHTDAFSLRRGAALAAAATFAAGFALVGPFAGISHASGCVSVVSNNTSSYPYHAVVKNNCGSTVSARLDLAGARDTACQNISPYGTATYTYRFGTLRDAVQC